MHNMEKNKKKIVIISGITGAIGSALFAEYGQDQNTVIYGISRKALPFESFLKEGKLPLKTLICSIGSLNDYSELFKHINYDIGEIIYVHSLGLYPFEVNREGAITIENDSDKDGVNDDVTKLTFNAFVSATQNLQKYWKGISKCILFGGIADKYRPSVHQSWWKTIERVKEYMKIETRNNPNLSMSVFNISSVLCPHEVITRPFVFTDTDAEQAYWLHPYDLTRFVARETEKVKPGFREFERYNIKPGFSSDTYYEDQHFTPRKVKELY